MSRLFAGYRLVRQDPIAPILGEQIAWTKFSPEEWQAFPSQERSARAWEAARIFLEKPGQLPKQPGFTNRRRFAAVSAGGTPEEWARLVLEIFAQDRANPASAIVRRHLSWPLLVFPENRHGFVELGGKVGANDGNRAIVLYCEMAGKPPIAAALFMRNLGAGEESELASRNIEQAAIVQLAENGESGTL